MFHKKTSNIQSIMFDNTKYNVISARRWLKKHKLKPLKKVHKTENYLRYRIVEPSKKYNYRTMKFNDGINIIYQIKN